MIRASRMVAHLAGSCGAAMVALFWFSVTLAGPDFVPHFLRPEGPFLLALFVSVMLCAFAVWKGSRWWWLALGPSLLTMAFAIYGAGV